MNSAVFYALFVLCYVSLCGLLALFLDYDVAKMATSVINTATTISIIALNVLLVWGREHLAIPPELAGFWDELNYFGNLILLPLVAAGYVASLLAEAQQYWKRKHKSIS